MPAEAGGQSAMLQIRTRAGQNVMLRYSTMRRILLLLMLLVMPAFAMAETPEIRIPRIAERITLADFEGMQPRAGLIGKLGVIEDFVQSTPKDGAPPSQKTVVYIAYDDENLYIIFVCFDSNPERIASSITRREGF